MASRKRMLQLIVWRTNEEEQKQKQKPCMRNESSVRNQPTGGNMFWFFFGIPNETALLNGCVGWHKC